MTRYLVTLCIVVAGITACQTPPPASVAPNDTGSVLVSSSGGMPEQRPGWLLKGNEGTANDGFRYFVGGADNHESETECKNAAYTDGVRVIARNAGVEVNVESLRRVREEGSSGGRIEQQIISAERGSMAANALVTGASAADFFWEKYESRYEGRVVGRFWKCWALVKISQTNLDHAATENGKQ